MQKETRLARELLKLTNAQSTGIYVFQKDDSLKVLEAQITGPDNSPYRNGVFQLEITVPDRYPFAPPSIKFITKIYHPNIDDNGRICLDLIKMPPSGNWKPTIGLEGLLIAIRMLLECPNPDDPLMTEIAEEYKKSYKTFVEKAKEYAKKYANAT